MWDNQDYSLVIPGCPSLTPFRLVWDTLVSPTSTICPTSSPGFPLVPSQTERMPRTMSPEWAHAMLNTYTIPPRATRAQNMRLQAAGANSCSVSSSLSLRDMWVHAKVWYLKYTALSKGMMQYSFKMHEKYKYDL